MDWIITGGSRGIGRALVTALVSNLQEEDRVFALARDLDVLTCLANSVSGPASVIPISVDLARIPEALEVGRQLTADVSPSAVLIHNAGLWPTKRVLVDGLEESFLVNCLGPLALQHQLLDNQRLARVFVVSAGLLIKGRFNIDKTPTGEDFSSFRTYCTTKLAGAIAMREMSRHHPNLDVAVVHPGVVQTGLGARSGILGALLRVVKKRWEQPDVCAQRLLRTLSEPSWSHGSGLAAWFEESQRARWPTAVERDASAVQSYVDQFISKLET